ncbi:MAG: hypothetical protein FJ030_10205 [Chloroflexi bacterium]|nr:hypothetical protein [Chloroflexota bacterium]
MDKKELRRNQVIGIAVGLIGGLMTGNFWPSIPAAIGWGGVILWGAAIGAALGSLAQFERAGQALTRRDHRGLNMVVGLSVPLILIALAALALNALR